MPYKNHKQKDTLFCDETPFECDTRFRFDFEMENYIVI